MQLYEDNIYGQVLSLEAYRRTAMPTNLSKYPSAKMELEQFYLQFLLSEGDAVLDALLEEFLAVQLCSEKSPDFLIKLPKGFNNGS